MGLDYSELFIPVFLFSSLFNKSIDYNNSFYKHTIYKTTVYKRPILFYKVGIFQHAIARDLDPTTVNCQNERKCRYQ